MVMTWPCTLIQGHIRALRMDRCLQHSWQQLTSPWIDASDVVLTIRASVGLLVTTMPEQQFDWTSGTKEL
jgi:hypothetical protein